MEKGPGNDREIDNLTIDGVDEAKMWAALMDRGYQGASKLGRFLTPKKKTAFCDLDSTNKKKNRRIEEDRVLVENYFGRTKLLWGMAKQTFQLKDDLYGPTMAMCFALTNYHVSLLPLCNKDGMVEDNYNRRLIDAYNRATKKRKISQQNSYKQNQARILMSMATNQDNNGIENLGVPTNVHHE